MTGVIDFLTSLVDSKSVNTIKGYVTVIAARHDPVDPVSLHPAVVLWVKGLVRSKGVPRGLVPPWNLEIILNALKGPPFEPICFASDKAVQIPCLVVVQLGRCGGVPAGCRPVLPRLVVSISLCCIIFYLLVRRTRSWFTSLTAWVVCPLVMTR